MTIQKEDLVEKKKDASPVASCQGEEWEKSSGRPISLLGANAKRLGGAGALMGRMGPIVGRISLAALKGLWWSVKLFTRFAWYMANMVFVVSQRRRIMDSDKSDVVKMQEMNNFRDSVDQTGFIDKNDMMWSKNEGSRRHFK